MMKFVNFETKNPSLPGTTFPNKNWEKQLSKFWTALKNEGCGFKEPKNRLVDSSRQTLGFHPYLFDPAADGTISGRFFFEHVLGGQIYQPF